MPFDQHALETRPIARRTARTPGGPRPSGRRSVTAVASWRRWRSRLRRSRVTRRVLVRRSTAVLVALLVGWAVNDTVARAGTDRARWGATRTVVVAADDIAAGELIDATNTAVGELPAALVPADALDSLPAGRRSSVELADGEPVLRRRLAGSDRGALAARLDEGRAAVSFPRAEIHPELAAGDRVDVYATVSDTTGTTSTRVAHAATVLELGERSVTIAVELDEVRAAAGASLAPGVAMVVLR